MSFVFQVLNLVTYLPSAFLEPVLYEQATLCRGQRDSLITEKNAASRIPVNADSINSMSPHSSAGFLYGNVSRI